MSNYSFCKEHGYYSKNGDTGCPWCMKRWAALWKKKAKELHAENWQLTKDVEKLELNLEHRLGEIDYLLKQ